MYNLTDTAYVGQTRSGSNRGADIYLSAIFSFNCRYIPESRSVQQSKIARLLGGNEVEGAENTAMHGLLLSVLLSVALNNNRSSF